MPNWCVNHMKITGAAGEITRFKQTCIIDGKLDFNTIIPQPLAWALFADSGELPTDPTMSKAWWERYHLCLAQWKEATGYDHPNDWATEHWGTKWNASEFRSRQTRPTNLHALSRPHGIRLLQYGKRWVKCFRRSRLN